MSTYSYLGNYRKPINNIDSVAFANNLQTVDTDTADVKKLTGSNPYLTGAATPPKVETEPGLFDTVGGWFQPQGESGASTAGNILSGVGTAVGIGSGLAGMYYSKKQADLNKERAKMEKDAYNRGVQREAQAEARMQQFAKNAGNGAFYA